MFKKLSLIGATLMGLAGSAVFASEIEEVRRTVVGDQPASPNAKSLVGRYLAESGAYSFARTFTNSQGAPGTERLVVLVSAQSYSIFKKYFSGTNLLFHFHEPHQHVFTAAFNGKRGNMGRLQDEMRYTYAGVLAIPILLTDREGERVQNFFSLADRVSRKNDVALFPWKLTNAAGELYCTKGKEKSVTDWFIRIPVGDIDANQARTEYDLGTLADETVRRDIVNVWAAPYAHQSLDDLLGLGLSRIQDIAITPAIVAQSLLTTAASDRVPVVFRFTDDHVSEFQHDFDPYLDFDYHPPNDKE